MNVAGKQVQHHKSEEASTDVEWLNYLPQDLLASCQQSVIPAGTHLFSEGELCSSFMLLLEGCVRIYKNSDDGREITLYRVRPGEFCVLSLRSLIYGEGFAAEAVADSRLVGVILSEEEFEDATDRSRDFRNYLLKTLSQRLAETTQLVSEVTFHRLDLRLACLLGQLFERSEGKPLRITHAELARELGTAREMISRILKEFEHQGCVVLQRNEVRLVSSEGLNWFGR